MKTTVDIPNALFRQAKSAAAEQGISLRVFISEALAERLRIGSVEDKPWMKMFGNCVIFTARQLESAKLLKKSSNKLIPRIGSDFRYEQSFGCGGG